MIRRSRSALIYAASLGASIGIFFLIRYFGHSLVATAAPGPQGPVRPTTSEAPGILLHVLLALVVILVVARILGAIFRKMHQPQVMGEVVAGILLGPSFLGWLAPDLAFQVLPANTNWSPKWDRPAATGTNNTARLVAEWQQLPAAE